MVIPDKILDQIEALSPSFEIMSQAQYALIEYMSKGQYPADLHQEAIAIFRQIQPEIDAIMRRRRRDAEYRRRRKEAKQSMTRPEQKQTAEPRRAANNERYAENFPPASSYLSGGVLYPVQNRQPREAATRGEPGGRVLIRGRD